MRYRNVKTSQVVITAGTVTGEDWLSDDPLDQEYEGEESQEPEEAPKTQKGKGRGKKAGEK